MNTHTTHTTPTEDSFSTPKEVDGKNFRIKSLKIFLTYKTHVNKTELFNYINNKKDVKEFMIVHENGHDDPVTPYEHTHAYFHFFKALDTTNCRYFDFDDIHPHISAVRNTDRCLKYCRKEDVNPYTNIVDKEPFHKTVERVVDAKSDLDAIKDCGGKMSDVVGILAIRKKVEKSRSVSSGARYAFENATLRQWQQDLLNYMESDDSDRHINWITNFDGNVGKTWFIKWLSINKPSVLPIQGSGRVGDIIFIVNNFLDEYEDPEWIIFNLTRRSNNFDSIYEILEMIKDGFITSTKYQGRTRNFLSPKVLVMSNQYPDLSQMSIDRWKIQNLDESGCLRPVTLEEVRRHSVQESENKDPLDD